LEDFFSYMGTAPPDVKKDIETRRLRDYIRNEKEDNERYMRDIGRPLSRDEMNKRRQQANIPLIPDDK
jgi:hypothetical protein